MGFSLTSPAPKKCDPTAENRVWGFFGEAPKTSRGNRPQSLQPRQGNRPSPTAIASGRTYWPSRDPIGERGGINLYGIKNNLVNTFDFLGLVVMSLDDDLGYDTETQEVIDHITGDRTSYDDLSDSGKGQIDQFLEDRDPGSDWDVWYTAEWKISDESFWNTRNGPKFDDDISEFSEDYMFSCKDGVVSAETKNFTSNNTNEPDEISLIFSVKDSYTPERKSSTENCVTLSGEKGKRMTISTGVDWWAEKGLGLGIGKVSFPTLPLIGSPDSLVGTVNGSHRGSGGYTRSSKCCCDPEQN